MQIVMSMQVIELQLNYESITKLQCSSLRLLSNVDSGKRGCGGGDKSLVVLR